MCAFANATLEDGLNKFLAGIREVLIKCSQNISRVNGRSAEMKSQPKMDQSRTMIESLFADERIPTIEMNEAQIRNLLSGPRSIGNE